MRVKKLSLLQECTAGKTNMWKAHKQVTKPKSYDFLQSQQSLDNLCNCKAYRSSVLTVKAHPKVKHMIITSGILIQVMTKRQKSNRGKLINTQNFQLFPESEEDHELNTFKVLLKGDGLGLRWILNWNLTEGKTMMIIEIKTKKSNL